ncbi:MAG: hypothetical protein AAF098_20330 [Pseudomonadota bacterium]
MKFSNQIRIALLFLASLSFLPNVALASGTIGGFSTPSTGPGPQRDEAYEFGKSVFKGRAAGSTKIDYCVSVDGEAKKLKRKTVKSFKNSTVKDFAHALVDCENPERLALTSVESNQVPLVLYYLNKRFKLELTDG